MFWFWIKNASSKNRCCSEVTKCVPVAASCLNKVVPGLTLAWNEGNYPKKWRMMVVRAHPGLGRKPYYGRATTYWSYCLTTQPPHKFKNNIKNICLWKCICEYFLKCICPNFMMYFAATTHWGYYLTTHPPHKVKTWFDYIFWNIFVPILECISQQPHTPHFWKVGLVRLKDPTFNEIGTQ